MLVVLSAHPWLRIFGQSESVLVTAEPFLNILAWSLVPALGYMGAKTFCDSLGRPTVPMLILYLAVLTNALLNWLLVFGNCGWRPTKSRSPAPPRHSCSRWAYRRRSPYESVMRLAVARKALSGELVLAVLECLLSLWQDLLHSSL